MSAPKEIYAKTDGSHGEHSGFWHSEEYRDDGEVRYLRADLTCGECSGEKCRSHMSPDENGRLALPATTSPACVDFTPVDTGHKP